MIGYDSYSATALKTTIAVLFVCGYLFIFSYACDGYKVTIKKLEECEKGKNVFVLHDANAVLSKECLASAVGCVDITKGFKNCKVNYDIRKTGIMFPIRGENDMCEEMAKMSQYPQALKMMQEYNITASCPMQKTRMCVPENGRLNVTSLKDKFNFLSGQYTGKITFTCDCGKSCFDFDVKFKRGK
ncbi:uncharacterized protein [Periplaneta americana]|uniref:uncharacterized protein n=1 Tax=Periplaneta americana TaxID=6978 RepID=UPI0037E85CB2